MSNVTLSIGTRSFTVACAPGEETHVHRLASLIDDKVAQGGMVGQTETRMLLFAALLLADEVDDLRGRKSAQADEPAPQSAPAFTPEMAGKLEALATRIENLATEFETGLESAPAKP